MINKDNLKEYGEVELCEVIDGMFHVKITKGFNNNAIIVFELMKKIDKSVGDKYPIIDKLVTEENLFEYVLKPDPRYNN